MSGDCMNMMRNVFCKKGVARAEGITCGKAA
jgi:hypothetical protein